MRHPHPPSVPPSASPLPLPWKALERLQLLLLALRALLRGLLNPHLPRPAAPDAVPCPVCSLPATAVCEPAPLLSPRP